MYGYRTTYGSREILHCTIPCPEICQDLYHRLKPIQTHQKRIISLSLGICLLLFTAWYLEYLKSQSEKHWFLVQSENFDHGDISKPKSKWSGLKLPDYVDSNIIAAPLSSTDLWRIEGGELHIFPGNTGGAYNLCYNEDISGNIRADFEYTPHHNNGNVNCFICGPTRHTAYVFHIGGYGSLNRVRLTKIISRWRIRNFHLA